LSPPEGLYRAEIYFFIEYYDNFRRGWVIAAFAGSDVPRKARFPEFPQTGN